MSAWSQGSQAKVFGLNKALDLVKIKRTLDDADRDISYYRLEESNHQFYNLGGGNVGLIHQIWEFNDRIRERVGHTKRT